MANNYNTTLQSNNTDLQSILNTINELPEAKGDPVLQDKTVTPTTSQQIVTADSGYDGLDTVTVNAMPTATQATPSITVNSSGLITATATQTAGYVTSGTKSATQQLTTQAAKTITPSAVQQTAVASGVYTTGAVTVAKIPDSYVQPRATIAATTYTPTTTDQTIAARTYCSGTQTIKGDANLVAGNIAEGVSIFGVTGTHSGGGSATPEILPITITDNGMYDPATNEYVLSNDNLHSSSRSIIIITQSENPYSLLVFFRENLSNSFIVTRGFFGGGEVLSIHGIIVNENSITVTGTLTETGYDFVVI